MTVTRTINAPIDVVFRTVSEINQFSRALPHIVKVEFLSEEKVGVGTRFRETRLMGKREFTTELEVTEFTENDRVRLVADSHGTVWDTLFVVRPESGNVGSGRTELTMTMTATARKLTTRIMNILIGGMVRKAVERDMDAVKVYCEK